MSHTNEERLQKYLARCGLGSRRKCEELVKEGKVTVNGETAELGQKVGKGDEVKFEGKVVAPLTKEYYIVNKPMGVVCSNVREKGMKRVIDLIPGGEEKGLFTVGRLDVGTSGIILVTNDGDFANKVIHPSRGLEKEYIVGVKGDFGERESKLLGRGVYIGDRRTARGKVTKLKKSEKVTKVWAIIHEGRTHIIKRMFETLDKEVVSLVRIRIGPLALGKLQPGDYRAVEPRLVARLSRDDT